MYKKTITYVDFNGKERTEDFYFDISETELILLDAKTPEGYLERMQIIGNKQDKREIMDMFTNFLRVAYGEKSPDGRFFDKSEEISRRFEHCAAYNVLFLELLQDAKRAAKFVNAVLPFNTEQHKEFEKAVNAKLDELEKKEAEAKEAVDDTPVTPIVTDGNIEE